MTDAGVPTRSGPWAALTRAREIYSRVAFFIGIALLLYALYVFLQLKYQERGVTNKRVILKKGIIGRKTEEMKLKSIETVEIEQGVFGRLLGFGTVKVTGRGVSDFLFKGVDDPMAVKRTIESISNPID